MPWGTCFFFIFAGLILIVAGGQVTVAGAKGLARIAGMSETLIGLTVVAVGTSLPELVTSVVAARKGEAGLAVGNVIGSNLFNLLFILGISAAIHPVTVTLASFCDLTILTAVSLIAYGFSISQKSIRRSEGVIMILIYVTSSKCAGSIKCSPFFIGVPSIHPPPSTTVTLRKDSLCENVISPHSSSL